MKDLKFRLWDEFTDSYVESTLSEAFMGSPLAIDGRFEVEQYTGLKDKNGKEIYEGDIVKFDCGDQTPAEVFYQAGSFFLRATDDNSLFYDPETDKPCPLGWLKTYGLEVIGNIHENPELLGEENRKN